MKKLLLLLLPFSCIAMQKQVDPQEKARVEDLQRKIQHELIVIKDLFNKIKLEKQLLKKPLIHEQWPLGSRDHYLHEGLLEEDL